VDAGEVGTIHMETGLRSVDGYARDPARVTQKGGTRRNYEEWYAVVRCMGVKNAGW